MQPNMLRIHAVYPVIVQTKGVGYSPGIGAVPEGYGRESDTGRSWMRGSYVKKKFSL